MAKRRGRLAPEDYVMPLVEAPIVRVYTFVHPIAGPSIAEFELTVSVSKPAQWITYDWKWIKKPSGGQKAILEAQVKLKRGVNGADSLSTVRALSNDDNAFFAGPRPGGVPSRRLHKHQLHEVDDFGVSGRIALAPV